MSDQWRFAHHYHSMWETFFYIAVGWIILLVGFWWRFFFQNYQTTQNLQTLQQTIDSQNLIAENNKKLAWYNKLLLVKQLNDTSKNLPWSEQIPKVVDMLNDIQKVDSSSSDSIVLSDFSISLDKVSLRGKVTNLRMLYVNKANFSSLIDRFLKLDFIKNMSIQNYQKNWLYYDFALNADVDILGEKK